MAATTRQSREGPPHALSQVEPAVRAVEEAEAGVSKAKERQKRLMKEAHEHRNAAIAEAAKGLTAAQGRYDAAVAAAAKAHEEALAGAKADVERANDAYAEACAVAEPLLQALRATTDRVSAVAGLRRQ